MQNFQIYPKKKKLPLRSLRLGPWPGILSVWRTSAANSRRAAGGGGGIGRGGALQCSTVEFAEMGGRQHPSSRGGCSVKKLGHMSNVAHSCCRGMGFFPPVEQRFWLDASHSMRHPHTNP